MCVCLPKPYKNAEDGLPNRQLSAADFGDITFLLSRNIWLTIRSLVRYDGVGSKVLVRDHFVGNNFGECVTSIIYHAWTIILYKTI